MDESLLHSNIDDIDVNKYLFSDHSAFLGFRNKDELSSQTFLANLMKNSLLLGAEKLLMSRKSPGLLTNYSNFENDTEFRNPRIIKGKYASKHNKKVCQKNKSCSAFLFDNIETESINENVVSKVVNCPLGSYNEFPLNIIAFLGILMLKFLGFQISLFIKFFTFPIGILNFWLMFLIFPFQMVTRIQDHFKKKLVRACNASYLSLISFICNRIKAQKSVLKLGIRFGRAFLCTIYVFFVLVGLLVLGFVIGFLVMRNVVEEPIHTREILNFDYTKTSPIAIAPITSHLVSGSTAKEEMQTTEIVGRRAIPYNQKLKLTVSLTLPESEYNRKLGIFQVRVESISTKGKTIVGSSYPTMLRFKSQPIRNIETIFKSVPLITGFQSEVQNLKITIRDFVEGNEPTACFKVILEQRAEFQAGIGVPEVYAASLDITSELPGFKRIVQNWRRTIFVWISVATFMCEIMVVLILCKPFILIGERAKNVGNDTDKKCRPSKIPWKKVT